MQARVSNGNTGNANSRGSRRKGEVNFTWLAFLGSIVVLAGLVILLVWDPSTWFQPKDKNPLVVYCAAGIRKPVEEAARQYEEEYGTPVQLRYDGSQKLFNSISLVRKGDLYIPGDESYLHTGRAKKLVDEIIPLATMTPVLAVPRDNPKGIQSLADVLDKKLGIVQANPEAAAVGKMSRQALERSGDWKRLQELVVANKDTVNEVANDVVVAAKAEAGIVWDVTARQYPDKLKMIELAEFKDWTANVSVGVLSCSERPTDALRFARYLAARDKGLVSFEKHHFKTVEGDTWEETPKLLILAGAMLRPAIEKTVAEFQEREGVEIRTVYNGCGILVGNMKTGKYSPDAYFACTEDFMTQVKDKFLAPLKVSGNQLVILVPDGNPKEIHSLHDLGKPGLRVGVGHEQQCAMGAITQETLKQGRVQGRVMRNVKVRKPTGDMLVSDLLIGKLDAIIAYKSNGAVAGEEKLDAIAIALPCAFANQPVAIGKDSKHKELVGRLVASFLTKQSRNRFETFGFEWKASVKMKDE